MTGLEKFIETYISSMTVDDAMNAIVPATSECPSFYGLLSFCEDGDCKQCWRDALEEEY